MFARQACIGVVSVACGLLTTTFHGESTVRSAEPVKTRTVEAGEIKLSVPKSWEQKTPTSTLRLAQFTVPKFEGDSEDGECAVFSFGGGAGGVDANVQRWIRQFLPKNRKVKVTSGQCAQGEYVLVDLQGTWLKPIGPPIRQQTVEMANARVLGIILNVKNRQNDLARETYFLRLTGPNKTTSANVDAFRSAIGANAKSEKDYKLTDE